MVNLKHTLYWGGIFEGKIVKDIELKKPTSKITKVLDHTGLSFPHFINVALAKLTDSIGGQGGLSSEVISEFWGTVKAKDAERCFLHLLRFVWPDPAEEAPQKIFCPNGHETDHIVDLHEVPEFDDIEKTFSVSLKDPIESGGETVTEISGETPTLRQMIKLEDEHSDKKIDFTFRLIAMTCSDKDRPQRKFNLRDIDNFSFRDRKTIEKKITTARLIDLSITGRCSQCSMKAGGSIDLADFI